MQNKYEFKSYSYKLNKPFNMNDLSFFIAEFYKEILIDINDNSLFAIILKLKMKNGNIKNIVPIQITNKVEIDYIKDIFNNFLFYKLTNNSITNFNKDKVDEILFVYRFIEPELGPTECKYNYPTNFDKNLTNELLPKDYKILPINREFQR